MQEHVSRPYLFVLVFTTGFTTLGVEMSASRLLDPWFGNSLPVWASLIGLIMLYLALGYWLGGQIADRSPRLITLLRLSLAGAFGVSLVPTIARPSLTLASQGIASLDPGLLGGSLLAVVILFAIPMTLLGCVAPFAIRLSLSDVENSGKIAGRLSALSTAGSILGSFLPVLLLIPQIGTRRTFLALSACQLLVIGFGLFRKRIWPELALTALVIAGATWLMVQPATPIRPAKGQVFERESALNYISVIDAGFERQLRLNEGEGIHSVYRGPNTLADGIWDYFLLAPAFAAQPRQSSDVQRVCILGLAGGTVAQLYTDAYGPIAIDGVEIDPAIIQAGQQYFMMTEPNLTAIASDARRFLTRTNVRYDLIAVDAYRPPYIPFHLTTVEFFQLARAHLTENGVLAMNVGRTHTDYRLVSALAATLEQVFPTVYMVDEPDNGALGNTLLVATQRATSLADLSANLPYFNTPMLAEVARRAVPHASLANPGPESPLFTDDRAPVEQLIHQIALGELFRQIQ
jgi:spermidine synthase